jgi:hypothetical protein
VIASQWWVDDEATYEEVRDGKNTHKAGYKKVQDFVEHVKIHFPGVSWSWIDIC